MKHILKFTCGLIMSLSIVSFYHPVALADDPEARKIMEQVETRDDGDNQTAIMEMEIFGKSGGKSKKRKVTIFAKDKGDDALRLMFIQHPPNLKNMAFLTWDYDAPDKDDDQWLYLSGQRKTKRIASSEKNGRLFGSHLYYSDMTSRNLVDYDFAFHKQKEKEVRGAKAWVIISVPRSKKVIDDTGYKESILFVRQDNFFVIRAVHREKSGNILKYMDVQKLEQIDGIWIGTQMHIWLIRGKRKEGETFLNWREVKFNQELDEDLFSVRRMEKGL